MKKSVGIYLATGAIGVLIFQYVFNEVLFKNKYAHCDRFLESMKYMEDCDIDVCEKYLAEKDDIFKLCKIGAEVISEVEEEQKMDDARGMYDPRG